MKARSLLVVFSWALVLLACTHVKPDCPPAHPSPFSLEEIELVTTIPVETTLSAEGTRSAAPVWVEMIRRAKKTIDIGEFYLVSQEGEPLARVLTALVHAARRDVRIRILWERKMAEVSKPVLTRLREQKTVQTATFDWWRLTRGINHAKYIIVDGREVFIGSQNFDWRSLKHVHETGLRIVSRAFAAAVSYIFELDWAYNTGNRKAYGCAAKNPLFRFSDELFLVASPPKFTPRGVRPAIDVLIELIDSAKKRITIQLLDYAVKSHHDRERFDLIDRALRRAAGRGVQVRMLVSDWNKRKPGVSQLQDLVQVKNIAIRFVTIPQSKDGFIPHSRVIHSKVMRVDDRVSWIGTSNWSHGYFFASRNLEVVCRIDKIAGTLDLLFEGLWNSSYAYPVEPGKEYEPPRIK